MKTIKIQVTQEDIDYASPCNGQNCAVARAVSRMLDREDVTVSVSYVWMNGGAYRFRVSDEMREFINRFDLKKKVKPSEFELEVLQEDK